MIGEKIGVHMEKLSKTFHECYHNTQDGPYWRR